MQETRVRSLIWEDAAEQLSPLSSVQSLSRVRLFATSWTVARQASLSLTNSQSLLKLMPIESVMPSDHLILCHPLLLPPCGTTKPMCHSYWACAKSLGAESTEPTHGNYCTAPLEPVLCDQGSQRNEKPAHCDKKQPPLAETGEKPVQQWRPSTAINKKN